VRSSRVWHSGLPGGDRGEFPRGGELTAEFRGKRSTTRKPSTLNHHKRDRIPGSWRVSVARAANSPRSPRHPAPNRAGKADANRNPPPCRRRRSNPQRPTTPATVLTATVLTATVLTATLLTATGQRPRGPTARTGRAGCANRTGRLREQDGPAARTERAGCANRTGRLREQDGPAARTGRAGCANGTVRRTGPRGEQ
jgi:hypothetical protein